MTIRISTGLRNAIAGAMGWAGAMQRGSIGIYSGSQPASADAAITGTLLGRVTVSSGALTKEVRSTGSITLTGGSTSVATLTVGGFNIIPDGAVPYNTSLAQTASDLCDAINRNGIMEASVSGATVTFKARPGAGTTFNGLTVTSTGSVTATYGNMASGVAAVNGLILSPAALGVISKPSGHVWSFAGVAAGTAGYFRWYASEDDTGALVSAAPWPCRMDGSIAVSGGDMALSVINVAVGAPNTIDSLTFTQPAA